MLGYGRFFNECWMALCEPAGQELPEVVPHVSRQPISSPYLLCPNFHGGASPFSSYPYLVRCFYCIVLLDRE